MTNRERILGISCCIGKQMCTMMAGAAVLLVVAETIGWAEFFLTRDK